MSPGDGYQTKSQRKVLEKIINIVYVKGESIVLSAASPDQHSSDRMYVE